MNNKVKEKGTKTAHATFSMVLSIQKILTQIILK